METKHDQPHAVPVLRVPSPRTTTVVASVSREQVLTRLLAAQVEQLPVGGPEHAGVLVGLYPASDADKTEYRVLLTVRSQNLRTHGGEVALPGGRWEAADKDIVDTAIREAHEEVGLVVSRDQVIACLPPRVSRYGVIVTPVVALLPAKPSEFKLCATEVDAVFDAPLAEFVCAENHWTMEWAENVHLHFFKIAHTEHATPFTVWGLTAGLLIVVATVVLDTTPEFETHVSPGVTHTPTSKL